MKKKTQKSNNELVTRMYMATFRTIENNDEGCVIEGTPIVFNQETKLIDWYGNEYLERIDPHALDDTDLKDIRLFINHNTDKIALARTKNGRGTMSFSIDDEGMKIKAILDCENNQEAKSLYSAIKRGDMDAMSFMFRIKDQEWLNLDTDLPTRVIKSISIVHEVSVVNFPAYPQTSVDARNISEETEYSPLVEARRAMEETIESKKSLLDIQKAKNENLLRIGGI